MKARQFERWVVVGTGLALVVLGLAVWSLEPLAEAARVVLGGPLVLAGALTLYAAAARWPAEEVRAGRREDPRLLLPLERLFLLPVVVLAAAGLLAVLYDPDLNLGVRLGVALTTLVVLLATVGFVVGRFGPSPRDLGRQQPRTNVAASAPAPPPRASPGGLRGLRARRARRPR